MKLIQINELRKLVDLQLPHICLNQDDLMQFLNIPWEAKRFYKLSKPGPGWYDKRGFFHNGKTTVWALYDYAWAGANRIPLNHIRIADKEIPTAAGGAYWSPNFSFEQEGSADRIHRMLKLKAFW